MDDSDDEFLERIGTIESSRGQDMDHPVMSEGIHAGTAAIGQYGLMPNTIKELAKRIKHRDARLNLGDEFQGDEEIEQYANPDVPDEEISETYSQNPELARRTAKYLKALLMSRHGGNEDKMAYGWNMGHNIPSESITDDKLNTNPYVAKFRKLNQYIKND